MAIVERWPQTRGSDLAFPETSRNQEHWPKFVISSTCGP